MCSSRNWEKQKTGGKSEEKTKMDDTVQRERFLQRRKENGKWVRTEKQGLQFKKRV